MKEKLNPKYYDENLEKSFDNIKLNEENINEFYTDLLNEVGKDGRYQKILFVLFCLGSFICCLILTSIPLQKDLPKYDCVNKYSFELENELKYKNYKTDRRFKIVLNDHKCIKKFCLDEIKEDKIIDKDELIQEARNEFNTVLVIDLKSKLNFITELDVMCEIDDFFGKITQIIFLGRAFGNFFFSYISDKYGRYKCFLLQFYILTGCYVTLIFFKNKILTYLVSFAACSCINVYILLSAMSTETMSQDLYSLLNGLLGASFTLCGIVDILVLYYLEDFNILLYIQLICCGITGYLIKYYLTETPIYLLDKNNYTTLNEVIRKIGEENFTLNDRLKNKLLKAEVYVKNNYEMTNLNSVNVSNFKNNNNMYKKINDTKTFNIIQNNDKSTTTIVNESAFQNILGPYLLVFNSKNTLILIAKQIGPYLAMFFVFYGQILNVEKMSGNMFFTTSIIYFGEIIAEVSGGYFLQKYPRKKLMIGCFGFSTFFCLFCNYFETTGTYPIIRLFFIIGNSFFISISFVVVFVYSAEIFDTNVKNTAGSILNNITNFFMLFSPYLIGLFGSPFGMFALISGIACLNGFILKETKK